MSRHSRSSRTSGTNTGNVPSVFPRDVPSSPRRSDIARPPDHSRCLGVAGSALPHFQREPLQSWAAATARMDAGAEDHPQTWVLPALRGWPNRNMPFSSKVTGDKWF